MISTSCKFKLNKKIKLLLNSKNKINKSKEKEESLYLQEEVDFV